MNYFITNNAFSRFSSEYRKHITIHYFDNCKLLNSDYIKNDITILNSGVKSIKFESEDDLFKFLKQNQCRSSVCTVCSQREGAESYDEHLKSIEEEENIIREFIKEYDEMKRAGIIK